MTVKRCPSFVKALRKKEDQAELLANRPKDCHLDHLGHELALHPLRSTARCFVLYDQPVVVDSRRGRRTGVLIGCLASRRRRLWGRWGCLPGPWRYHQRWNLVGVLRLPSLELVLGCRNTEFVQVNTHSSAFSVEVYKITAACRSFEIIVIGPGMLHISL